MFESNTFINVRMQNVNGAYNNYKHGSMKKCGLNVCVPSQMLMFLPYKIAGQPASLLNMIHYNNRYVTHIMNQKQQ